MIFDVPTKQFLARRIRFLLDEAAAGSVRDQTITFAMRTLSNYATIGADGGSQKIKSQNKRISKASLELLRESNSLNNWYKSTINEHPIPLRETWLWLLAQYDRLNVSDVWLHFRRHRMVTITIGEDGHLTKLGLRSACKNQQRYKAAGIEVICLSDTPEILLRRS